MKVIAHAGSNYFHDPQQTLYLVYQGMLEITVLDCDKCTALCCAGCSHGHAPPGQASQDAHRELQLPSQTGE